MLVIQASLRSTWPSREASFEIAAPARSSGPKSHSLNSVENESGQISAMQNEEIKVPISVIIMVRCFRVRSCLGHRTRGPISINEMPLVNKASFKAPIITLTGLNQQFWARKMNFKFIQEPNFELELGSEKAFDKRPINA